MRNGDSEPVVSRRDCPTVEAPGMIERNSWELDIWMVPRVKYERNDPDMGIVNAGCCSPND